MRLLPSSLLALLSTSLAVLLPSLAVANDSRLVSEQNSISLSKRHWDDQSTYNVTFLHVNDLHAHLDEFQQSGTDCPVDRSVECLGGYARLGGEVMRVRDGVKNSLLFNAGDEFQGTLFYSFLGTSAISTVLNTLNFSLITLGNHEFDHSVDEVAAFLSDLTFPAVSSNLFTSHPLLRKMLHPFWIFEEHEMAVVGLTTYEALRPGGETGVGRYEDVQGVVDGLLAGRLGGERGKKVKRVVALTHIGYEEDIKLARNSRNIHLIIGGHSHTPLGGEAWYSQGPYPTIVKDLDGQEVLIVTSYRWGEHLGRIDVAFAPDSGKIVAYSGGPIRLTEDHPKDPQLDCLITTLRKPFDDWSHTVIGTTVHDLDHLACLRAECTLGNAITDAMVHARHSAGATHVSGAIMNSQGIRATFFAPNITQGVLALAFPFNNEVVDVQMSGKELWEVFEGLASGENSKGERLEGTVQVSRGIQFAYNPENRKGTRLISLWIGGEPVDFERTYTITTLSFLLLGGGHIFPRPIAPPPPPSLFTPNEALRSYVEALDLPMDVRVEGRIRVTGERKQLQKWEGVGWGRGEGEEGQQVRLGRWT